MCYDFYRSTVRHQDYPVNQDCPIMYLPGLIHSKEDGKSFKLQSWCKRLDFTFLCSDYFGVGRSSGTFTDGSVGRWTKDAISLIEKKLLSQNKVILVGHGII